LIRLLHADPDRCAPAPRIQRRSHLLASDFDNELKMMWRNYAMKRVLMRWTCMKRRRESITIALWRCTSSQPRQHHAERWTREHHACLWWSLKGQKSASTKIFYWHGIRVCKNPP